MRRQLRDLADIHYGRSPNEVLHVDGVIPVVGTGGVYGSSLRPLFQEPAVVVPRKGSLGNPQYMPGPFWAVDTTYAVLPKKGVHGQWLYYNLDLFDLTKLNEATGVPSISRDWLSKIEFEDPGETSQKHIAEILITVDEAIKQTEALISKTQQIKTGLMHDLFTRGVTEDGQVRPTHEDAPQLYKESELGWIPKEWDLPRLGTVAEIVSGVTLKGDVGSGPIEVPYLRVANVQDGYLDMSEVKTIRVSSSQLSKLALRRGDVLMNEGGDYDKLGRGTVWNEEIETCIHQNHVFRVRPRREELRSQFLAYWSQSSFGKKYFVLSSKQSTNLASINSKQLHNLPIARPSLEEQQRIDAKLEMADNQIANIKNEFLKLKQLKAGLMAALLTGRVPLSVKCAPEASEDTVNV